MADKTVEKLGIDWKGFRQDALLTAQEIMNAKDALESNPKIMSDAMTLGTALGVCIGTWSLVPGFAVGQAAMNLMNDIVADKTLVTECATLVELLKKLAADIAQ